MRIDLIKYQALGNDYLVFDLPGDLERLIPLLPLLCDRNRGLGSDGLLAFDPAKMSVRIFNPDSSEAQKSGNGLRITAAHAVLEHGAGDRFELTTRDRANQVRILAKNGAEIVSELDIGRPSFRAGDLPARFDGEPDRVTLDTAAGRVEAMLVSVGNPHCVVFGEPVTKARCLELGPLIENHEAFPERTNVQLFEVMDRARARGDLGTRGRLHPRLGHQRKRRGRRLHARGTGRRPGHDSDAGWRPRGSPRKIREPDPVRSRPPRLQSFRRPF